MTQAHRSLRTLCLVLPIFALGACSRPTLEFRGYSNLSSCAEIIDAELANGSVFLGGYQADDLDNPGYVTELSGSIFDERVQIDIQCDIRGYISSIHYTSLATDPMETGEVFFRFADELATRYGEPTQIVTEDGHSLRFLCHNPSPIVLDEWRLAGDDEGEEPEHEVYLAVMPLAVDCLDESAG